MPCRPKGEQRGYGHAGRGIAAAAEDGKGLSGGSRRARDARGISPRTGCFCNPGTGEAAFALDHRDLGDATGPAAAAVDDYLDRLGLPSGGAVRISPGPAANAADVAAFLGFVTAAHRDRLPDPVGLEPRMVC